MLSPETIAEPSCVKKEMEQNPVIPKCLREPSCAKTV